jgi:hypothetical protein
LQSTLVVAPHLQQAADFIILSFELVIGHVLVQPVIASAAPVSAMSPVSISVFFIVSSFCCGFCNPYLRMD